jgi:RNA polymerase sigma-70 factor (ECF subfamily)
VALGLGVVEPRWQWGGGLAGLACPPAAAPPGGAREEHPVSDDAVRPLVERARAGDQAAFAEIFRRHEADVARACRRLLGPGPAAEDAAAEAFLRARGALDRFEPDRPLAPWLLSIASHCCIDALRRQRTETRLFDPRDVDAIPCHDPGPSPLGRLARAEERAELLEEIESLPDKYRVPLVLRYWSDLDYAAIAELLGATREQVGTLLFRAKRQLRERLAARSGGRA